MPEGQACSLPLNPGVYAGGDEVIDITIEEIPDVLAPFLKGKIRAVVEAMKADGTVEACLKVDLEFN